MLTVVRRADLRRGFTMIECAIVLAMMGIVTSISIGRIHRIIVQQRVMRAATAIQNDIEGAFALATRNRRPIRITWNATTMQFDVTDRAGTTSYRTLALGDDAYALEPGSVTVSLSPLEVYPNGLAADTLAIRLSGFQTSKYVHVSRAGLVQVCNGSSCPVVPQ